MRVAPGHDGVHKEITGDAVSPDRKAPTMNTRTITRTEALALTTDDGSFSVIADEAAYDAARALCRGEYQENLLAGVEALSGSTLTGTAARYRGRYQASARNLLERMREHGIAHGEVRAARGKRILVIGAEVVEG